MARLLEVYDDMRKEAEFAKVAEEVQFMFAKYAETAEDLLKEEYGKEYTSEDVDSLTQALMERDANILEEQEKVAEYEGIGRQLAHMYFEELKKEAGGPKQVGVIKNVINKVQKGLKAALPAASKKGGQVKKQVTKAVAKGQAAAQTAAQGVQKRTSTLVGDASSLIKKHPLPAVGIAAGAGLAGGAGLGAALSGGDN